MSFWNENFHQQKVIRKNILGVDYLNPYQAYLCRKILKSVVSLRKNIYQVSFLKFNMQEQ